MDKQTIIFDMDDTLIHCNKYFEMIISQFADQMEMWFRGFGITEKQIRDVQQELDVAMVEQHGFTLEHFPQSFIETYEHYSNLTGYPQNPVERDWLNTLGASVYDQEFEAFPNMLEVLQKLKDEGHLLCLYTGGVEAIQQKKVDKLQLSTFFEDRIYIAQHKTVDVLERILVEHQYDRKHTWMIGNSIRTDIVPALQTGIHAIFIPAQVEWQYNNIEIKVTPQGAFLTLKDLTEVPHAIRTFAPEANSANPAI
ncbi:HAD family hydrolase [Paenibacillus swuensis]|uniref:HAD family hydrolase n=1 Tax=Paenibacillus swuensis TaxID=1178515 RepID=A0A172TLE0_9BACL|nr:HAD family hydrolase [Paenibacillus swuensis]ANE47786.1 HAD family hydrolase [Paenibacillus swuensis]